MQKTLAFLERNVQWFALGLGGIFLLWVAYQYVFIPPASAKIGNRVVTAGEISDLTDKEAVKPIVQQINSPNVPSFKVEDVVKPWQLAMEGPSAPGLASAGFDSLTENNTVIVDRTNNPVLPTVVPKLPDLPKANPLPPESGLSVVTAPPPPAGGAQNVAPTPQDKLWVTAPFFVASADINKSFHDLVDIAKANGQQTITTVVLQVVLQRQRAIGWNGPNQPIFPQGESGIEDVPPPQFDQQLLQPMPADSAPTPAKIGYSDWAKAHASLITQPPFYSVSNGDAWPQPQLPAPAAAPAGAAPALSTPEFGRPVVSQIQPITITARASVVQVRTIPPDPGMILAQRIRDPNVAIPGSAPNPFNNFNNPNNNQGGAIDLLNLNSDILIWAHDDNVKPGQAYRYRITYKMYNPVFGFNGLAAKNVIDTFAIVSQPSDWSPPASIKLTTQFWVTTLSGNSARVDLFHWQSGAFKEQKLTLQPGDSVPGTDLMIVDTRGSTYKDRAVLLTDETGAMSVHLLSDDQSDPKFKDMQDKVNAPKSAEPTRAARPRRGQ